ncbi:DNA repair protein rad51c [Gaertneriomyces sp. JEL0708]|nr:DNA repair protein rad51c [Gaertneriomyces sp. JEL0708]
MGFLTQRPIASLDLEQGVRVLLAAGGYRTTGDLAGATAQSLVRELGMTLDQANNVLRKVHHEPIPSISALDALSKERSRCSITTSCKAFDEMLGGSGMPGGRVTEICGAPGMGKTQYGMQLCVNVQLPPSLGGANGDAIYIDTEGSFIVERVAQMAAATINSHHLTSMSGCRNTVDDFLAHVYVFRVHGYLEEVALMNQLDEFLKNHKNVRLIVIDSIAFHFRQSFTDMGLRTRLLNGMAQTLRRVADQYNIAVVLTNQMTTKINRAANSSGTDSTTLVPALGSSWGHACTNRIILYWQRDIRCATLVKSPNLQERTVQYDITPDGVRDVASGYNPLKRRLEQ